MIQSVTFLSPILGGHQQPLKGSLNQATKNCQEMIQFLLGRLSLFSGHELAVSFRQGSCAWFLRAFVRIREEACKYLCLASFESLDFCSRVMISPGLPRTWDPPLWFSRNAYYSHTIPISLAYPTKSPENKSLNFSGFL